MGKPWGDHTIMDEAWAKIAVVVNEAGPHSKNAGGWKLFFEQLKSKAKQKVGAQRRYINKTGSGVPSTQLNDVDFKIASLYGKNHFDGLQGVRECGFPGRKFTSNPILNAIPEKPLQKVASAVNSSKSIPKITSQNGKLQNTRTVVNFLD